MNCAYHNQDWYEELHKACGEFVAFPEGGVGPVLPAHQDAGNAYVSKLVNVSHDEKWHGEQAGQAGHAETDHGCPTRSKGRPEKRHKLDPICTMLKLRCLSKYLYSIKKGEN